MGKFLTRHLEIFRDLMRFLPLGLLLLGCVSPQPIPRKQIVDNLNPIVEIEARANRITLVIQKLAMLGELKEADQKGLKEHFDVYYIHHKAAAVFLAQGDLVSYESHIQLAGKELDGIESKLQVLARSKFQ